MAWRCFEEGDRDSIGCFLFVSHMNDDDVPDADKSTHTGQKDLRRQISLMDVQTENTYFMRGHHR
jgi:hypothetical protein